jgi:predicted ATPase
MMTPPGSGEKGITPEPPQSPRRLRAVQAAEAESATRTPERTLHNLPSELSSFVGREKELAEVKRLLESTRLLTLTGSGGCGKTRLALAAASDVVEGFEGGVWLVDLAPLADPSLVPQALASTLGVREQPARLLTETLSDYLGSKKVLVILDNCEHLIETCAELVETLLRSCPELSILATSREALGIAGEVAWPVPSLTLPDLRRLPDIESLPRYEAARLFVERAAAVKPTFALTEQNAPAVVRVCYRLDGIPLAIELAAARTKVLAVEEISERLDGSLGLLASGGRTALPRHRTLRATMDWSHELLPEDEQTLFRRLTVFAGGFTLEAAESVCAGEDLERDEVLELLSHLVDKSLVTAQEQGGETRYRLLEMVRKYGREKLDRAEEVTEVGRRHADFYVTLAEEAEPELKGGRQVAWLERLETEHDNLRAAMRWLLGQVELEEAARLGWALWLFWGTRANFAEGRRAMEQALSAKGSEDMPASRQGEGPVRRGHDGELSGRPRFGRVASGGEPQTFQRTQRQAGKRVRAEQRRLCGERTRAAPASGNPHRRVRRSLPRGGGGVGRRDRVGFPGGIVARPGRSRTCEEPGGARTCALPAGRREAGYLGGALYPGDPGAGRARPGASAGSPGGRAGALGGVGERR